MNTPLRVGLFVYKDILPEKAVFVCDFCNILKNIKSDSHHQSAGIFLAGKAAFDFSNDAYFEVRKVRKIKNNTARQNIASEYKKRPVSNDTGLKHALLSCVW